LISVSSPSYRATLVTYLGPLKRRVGLLGVVLFASIGLQLVVPLVLQRFIDTALSKGALATLLWGGVIYLVAGVANQLLSAGATYIGADVGWTATNRLRHDLAEHLLGLDMGFHNDTTPGEMIERVDGDVTAVSNFLSRFIVRLLGSALLLAGVVVVTWFVNPWIGLAMSAYVAAVLALLYRMRRLAVEASEMEREVSARLFGFVEERLAGIDDIRANGAAAYSMRRFVGVMRDYFFNTRRAWRKRTTFWVSANVAFWSGDAMALAVGTALVVRGSISVGTAFLILQYMTLVRTPIEQVTQEFQELQKAAGGIIRIDQLRRRVSRLDETGTVATGLGPLAVQFDRVGFAYEDRAVLTDVSFSLEPGTVLGLLGRTGGGKTTITRLISRLYDPVSGSVLVGGVDLRSADPDTLRRSVGVVTQDVQLFGATVRDNLTFFAAGSSDADLLAALAGTGLDTWVEGLGLDTVLGAGGQGLSAGEAQLLAFARVFLQNPGVVILDEPSSRLDPATELVVASATERLFAGRTVVIVAHRLETVRLADEIMVVSDGRIVEHGKREELAANPQSRYSLLLAAGDGSDLLGGAAQLGERV
jgi:ABC-type multidrug transport system fused ATPase/permease subunit